MDRLPAELIFQIAFEVPFSLDALALSHVCRTTYHALSSANKLFWYKRRRLYPQTAAVPGQWTPSVSAKGQIAKDIQEAFDPKKDYKDLVVRALKRVPEEGVKKPILRCQVCCLNRAYKVWDDFGKALCPLCFEVMAVDRSAVAFLKLLDIKNIRMQQKRRGLNIRHCYWVPDLEREVREKYPGQSLAALIKMNKTEKSNSEKARAHYRELHFNKLKSAAEKRWNENPEYIRGYRQYFEYEKSRRRFDSYVVAQARAVAFKLATGNGKEKDENWVQKQLDKHFFPRTWPPVPPAPQAAGASNGRSGRAAASSITSEYPLLRVVRCYHYERFHAIERRILAAHNAANGNPSPPDYGQVLGICPLCYESSSPVLLPDIQYMYTYRFVSHMEQKHPREYYTRGEITGGDGVQTGDEGDGWWTFATGVEGREPWIKRFGVQGPAGTIPNFTQNRAGTAVASLAAAAVRAAL